MSKKTKLTEEVIYSPVNDHRVKANLMDSPIWKTPYNKEDLTDEIITYHGNHMYEYTIKFDGLTPKQVTKVKRIKKIKEIK